MGINKWNSAAARLLPTDAENPAGGPLAQSNPFPWRHQFFGGYDVWAEQGAHPSGDQDVDCARVRADWSKLKGGKVWMQSHVMRAGAADSVFMARYSTNLGSTFTDLASVPLATANANVPIVGSKVLIPNAAAVGDVLLKLVRRGGDGVVKPAAWNAIIEAISAGAAQRPSDLPQGDWGDVLWSINAANLGAIYANNDEAPIFPDDMGNFDAMTAGASVVNAPHYRATGFPGGLPCVQTTGLNLPYRVVNPTQPYGDWTYYAVTAGLDGGDTAFLINGTSGYPFGFSLKLTSNQVCAEVGSSAFGDNTVCNTDTGWGMANKHIWRFVMNANAVHFWLFRDGILVADHNSTNFQTRNSSVLTILDAAGGLGMDALLGRMVAYNRSHLNVDPLSTVPASGLNAVETVLKGYWGTP